MKAVRDELLARACELLGGDHVEDVEIRYGKGHSGIGWYGFDAEYPDEGSVFLAPDPAPHQTIPQEAPDEARG